VIITLILFEATRDFITDPILSFSSWFMSHDDSTINIVIRISISIIIIIIPVFARAQHVRNVSVRL